MGVNRIKSIAFAGSYKEQYPRNAIMIKGLKRKGIVVHEFNNTEKGILKSLIFVVKNIRRFKNLNYDLILLHAPNLLQIIFCKFFSKIKKVPLVFDVFLSKYLSYYHDRKIYKDKKVPKILIRIYYYLLDIFECHIGDLLLLDTYAQIKYFHDKFNIPTSKFRRLFVGAQDDIFFPLTRADSKKERFIIGFWGTFIPLHGVDYIIKAANLLRDVKDIKFVLIGDGITFKDNKKVVQSLNLSNIEFMKKNFVVSNELYLLPSYIAEFDIGLGIFGSTLKSKLVIPNKLFEGIAMKLPMISAESNAIKELFTDNENIIMCDRYNPQSLVDAIILLKNDEKLRKEISNQGFQLFLNSCSIDKIGNSLVNILERFLNCN